MFIDHSSIFFEEKSIQVLVHFVIGLSEPSYLIGVSQPRALKSAFMPLFTEVGTSIGGTKQLAPDTQAVRVPPSCLNPCHVPFLMLLPGPRTSALGGWSYHPGNPAVRAGCAGEPRMFVSHVQVFTLRKS